LINLPLLRTWIIPKEGRGGGNIPQGQPQGQQGQTQPQPQTQVGGNDPPTFEANGFIFENGKYIIYDPLGQLSKRYIYPVLNKPYNTNQPLARNLSNALIHAAGGTDKWKKFNFEKSDPRVEKFVGEFMANRVSYRGKNYYRNSKPVRASIEYLP
jgi:hypothetical protein